MSKNQSSKVQLPLIAFCTAACQVGWSQELLQRSPIDSKTHFDFKTLPITATVSWSPLTLCPRFSSFASRIRAAVTGSVCQGQGHAGHHDSQEYHTCLDFWDNNDGYYELGRWSRPFRCQKSETFASNLTGRPEASAVLAFSAPKPFCYQAPMSNSESSLPMAHFPPHYDEPHAATEGKLRTVLSRRSCIGAKGFYLALAKSARFDQNRIPTRPEVTYMTRHHSS